VTQRPLSASERQRLRTNANLWRALIPLLVIVGVVVIFTWPNGRGSDGVHVVDVSAPIAAAREQAGFEVLAPTGLSGRDWRATSTRFVAASPTAAASFRIGYVSPSGKYAEFTESDDVPAAVLATFGPLDPAPATRVGDQQWQRYQTRDQQDLIVKTMGQVTVVVTGSAPLNELTELAGSLH